MEETVVTFKNANRSIAIYFTWDKEKDTMDYDVTVNPEHKEGEEADLPMILSSILLNAMVVEEDK